MSETAGSNFIKDPNTGNVTELHCSHDPETRGGWSRDGRKVKGTSHWISAAHASPAEFRLYDRLFTVPNPDEGEGYLTNLNSQSLERTSGFIESGMTSAPVGSHFQFERQGYFCTDLDSVHGTMVFNRSVSLKDSWLKIEAQ